MASSALAICRRNPERHVPASSGCFMRWRRSPAGKVLHRDVGMIVRDTQIVDAHDVLVLQAGDDFVFLQESIEADEALGHVRHLAEDLEHHESPGAFALGKIDLAHAAAADLANAAMAADDHRCRIDNDFRKSGLARSSASAWRCSLEAVTIILSSRSRSSLRP